MNPLQELSVSERLQQMDRDRVIERIWRKDHTVWKDDPTEITDRLGWLTVSDLMHERLGELVLFAEQAAADGFETAVLLGMGGSSLAPEVFMRTFGSADGALELIVLYFIRDNLTLNIIMLIYPLDSLRTWEGGG